MDAVCVYCGASAGNDAFFADVARDFGRAVAGRGMRLVYGGGSVGLMGHVANAALEAGGQVTGVIPERLWEKEVGHKGLTDMYVVPTMHARKARMVEREAARQAQEAELARLAAIEAERQEQLRREAEALEAQHAAEAEAAKAALEAEQKAKRDARYAARKAAKKKAKRRGY